MYCSVIVTKNFEIFNCNYKNWPTLASVNFLIKRDSCGLASLGGIVAHSKSGARELKFQMRHQAIRKRGRERNWVLRKICPGICFLHGAEGSYHVFNIYARIVSRLIYKRHKENERHTAGDSRLRVCIRTEKWKGKSSRSSAISRPASSTLFHPCSADSSANEAFVQSLNFTWEHSPADPT